MNQGDPGWDVRRNDRLEGVAMKRTLIGFVALAAAAFVAGACTAPVASQTPPPPLVYGAGGGL